MTKLSAMHDAFITCRQRHMWVPAEDDLNLARGYPESRSIARAPWVCSRCGQVIVQVMLRPSFDILLTARRPPYGYAADRGADLIRADYRKEYFKRFMQNGKR